jgi:AGZA family xanthine/uracil permease-like MFS transporter
MATGVTIALMCFFGLFGLLSALLPLPAIVPILLYIGFMIGAQAFQAVPRVHAAAVVAALIPNIASWATGLMDNVLSAAGTTAAQVGADKLAGAGVVYDGLKILGSGAILAGLVLGAVVAFVIDRAFVAAAAFAAFGAVLSFVGLIHAEKVQWNADGQVSLGYLFAALVCLAFAALRLPRRTPDPTDDRDGPADGAIDGDAAVVAGSEPVAA